jgi:hypothetical protein
VSSEIQGDPSMTKFSSAVITAHHFDLDICGRPMRHVCLSEPDAFPAECHPSPASSCKVAVG